MTLEGSMLSVVWQALKVLLPRRILIVLSSVSIFKLKYLFAQCHCKLLVALHCYGRFHMQILHMCLQFGCQLHAICAQVAVTTMQIFPILHVCDGHLGSISMWLAAKQLIDLTCLAASRTENLYVLAAIALHSRQFFALMLGEHILK